MSEIETVKLNDGRLARFMPDGEPRNVRAFWIVDDERGGGFFPALMMDDHVIWETLVAQSQRIAELEKGQEQAINALRDSLEDYGHEKTDVPASDFDLLELIGGEFGLLPALHSQATTLEWAIRQIAELEQGQGWVACEEREPATAGDYLVWRDGNDVRQAEFGKPHGVGETRWFAFDQWGGLDLLWVTHWRPLPAPPITPAPADGQEDENERSE